MYNLYAITRKDKDAMAVAFNPNVAEVNLVHIWDGQKVENLLYFSHATEPHEAELQVLADGVRTYWQSTMLPLMSSKVAMFAVEVTKMEPVPAEVATAVPTLPNIGGDTNAALPNSVSLSISFRTGLSGRSFRGRNYWLGLTEPNVVDNEVQSSLRGSIVGAYGDMMSTGAVAVGWTWGVYSQWHLGLPRVEGLFSTITSVVIVDPTVDSQRRRLPGRGN